LGQLQTDLKQFEDAGIKIVGISYDTVETLKQYTDKNKIGYLLLSDAGSKTIDAYGIRNTEVKAGSRVDGIPHPGTFLIDQEGIIRAKLSEEDYKIRHTTAALLEASHQLSQKK
jgi:peroxiredoxin|tara:strand:- start:220 stop:561 length:342 start_codon:yes stop_codon:yes gene_type:complete